LILVDILENELKGTTVEFDKNEFEVLPLVCDVSRQDQVQKIIKQAIEERGRIDILVNNAGVNETGTADKFPVEKWEKVMDTDLKGVFIVSQEVGKKMIKRNQGCIINIASIAAFTPLPGRAAYCSAKAAVMMLTKVLAIDWAKYNIRVNAVAPGYVKTDMIEEMADQGVLDLRRIQKRIPMGRIGEPKEIGEIVCMMVCEKSSYMTGSTVLVDGGWAAYGYI